MDTTRKPPPVPKKKPAPVRISPAKPAKKRAVVGDETEATPKLPRLRRLTSAEDIAHEMRVVYRAMRNSTIEPAVGSKLVFVLTQLASLGPALAVEARVTELEKRADGYQRARGKLQAVA